MWMALNQLCCNLYKNYQLIYTLIYIKRLPAAVDNREEEGLYSERSCHLVF